MGTDDGVSAGIHQNVQNKLHNICFASIKFVFASFLSVQWLEWRRISVCGDRLDVELAQQEHVREKKVE